MKEWTIMVYMAGDNNLSENMAFSLEGLEISSTDLRRLNQQDQVNLLAYFDSSSLTAPTHYIDYSEAETYRHPIEKNDRIHKSVEAETHFTSQEDSASAYSILNFVHWCLKKRKRTAKNYALIFSAHSFGFHGTSFLRDETSGSFMTLSTFRKTLEQINSQYLEPQEKIAILGFDSCVMSMLEVGYELRDVAQTLVASEGSLPNSGWSYAPMLKEFVASFSKEQRESQMPILPTAEYVKAAARGFVKAFITQYKNLAIGGRSVDIASWDLAKIDPVAENLNDLAKELNKHLYLVEKINAGELTDRDIAVYQELKKIILQSHFEAQTYMREQCIDLKDFCQRLIIECKYMENTENARFFKAIAEKSKDVIKAIDDCVLKCGYSGEEYQFSNGISLYFPWTYVTYYLTQDKYQRLIFNQGKDDDGSYNEDVNNPKGVGKDWNKFLENYVTQVTVRKLRKNAKGQTSMLDDFSKKSVLWNQQNPLWNKDNPHWNKDNPHWNKDNPHWNKDNPHWNKGEIGEYLFYFGRFKNFQMHWEINGYTDEVKFDDTKE
ncbi:MAG: clostripain-related cysteine peptidase [Pyrinomonadaceae bacterium]|nr:clostripain-related cysteine peptidase [Pyrinomonadaceae bacterium]